MSRKSADPAEIEVLLASVEGERQWWVFRNIRPLAPDWTSAEGHWYYPCDELVEVRLTTAGLMSENESAFARRGLKTTIGRDGVFRVRVKLRVPPGRDFDHVGIMNEADVEAADDDFAKCQAAARELEAQLAKEAAAAPQPQPTVATSQNDVTAGSPPPKPARSARQPKPPKAVIRFKGSGYLAVPSKTFPQVKLATLNDGESPLLLIPHLNCTLDRTKPVLVQRLQNPNIFERLKLVVRAQEMQSTVDSAVGAVAAHHVEPLNTKFRKADTLFIASDSALTKLTEKSPRAASAAKSTAEPEPASSSDDADDSGTSSETESSSSAPSSHSSSPARGRRKAKRTAKHSTKIRPALKTHRSDGAVAAEKKVVSVAPTYGTAQLSCCGVGLWRSSEAIAPSIAAGSTLTDSDSSITIKCVSAGVFVTEDSTVDEIASAAPVAASVSAPPVPAEPRGGDDGSSYLADLLDCVNAVR